MKKIIDQKRELLKMLEAVVESFNIAEDKDENMVKLSHVTNWIDGKVKKFTLREIVDEVLWYYMNPADTNDIRIEDYKEIPPEMYDSYRDEQLIRDLSKLCIKHGIIGTTDEVLEGPDQGVLDIEYTTEVKNGANSVMIFNTKFYEFN